VFGLQLRRAILPLARRSVATPRGVRLSMQSA
jgi:hypothetical protein